MIIVLCAKCGSTSHSNAAVSIAERGECLIIIWTKKTTRENRKQKQGKNERDANPSLSTIFKRRWIERIWIDTSRWYVGLCSKSTSVSNGGGKTGFAFLAFLREKREYGYHPHFHFQKERCIIESIAIFHWAFIMKAAPSHNSCLSAIRVTLK